MNSLLLDSINSHRHLLDLDIIQLSYLEFNPGGEPVLLLHGLADCAIAWASAASRLKIGVRNF